MKTCAVVSTVSIEVRRIISPKVFYSRWLPAISQKIEKTSDEKYAGTLLFLSTSLSFALMLRDVSKKYFDYSKIGGWAQAAVRGEHKQLLGGSRPPWSPVATALD